MQPDKQRFMTCESPFCNETEGKDYERKNELINFGFKDEPIFLCNKHAADHVPIQDQILTIIFNNGKTEFQQFKTKY